MTTSPLAGADAVIWLGQPGEALRIFEIKIIERIRGHELPGERRLAALAGAQERHNPAPPNGGLYHVEIGSAVDHGNDRIP